MKKLICLLLALLMLPLAVHAEEAENVTLANYYLYKGDNATLLHLRLQKTGERPFVFNGVTAHLLDAQGEPIAHEAAELLEKPLTEVPSGTHYFTATLGFILPEGAEAADFAITDMSGFFADTQTPVYLQQEPGCLLTRNGVYQLMAWVEAEENVNASQYFVTAAIADAQNQYLGNAWIPGGFRLVKGADMPALISSATGWTPEQITANGFSFPAETYAVSDWTDLSYFDTGCAPARIYTYGYVDHSNVDTGHVGLYADVIRMEDDGSFVIEGLLINESQAHYAVKELRSLTLYDARGNTAECTDFAWEVPHYVLGRGELLPYRITGSVQAGFPADSFYVDFSLAPTDTVDHQQVSVEHRSGLGYAVADPVPGADTMDYYVLRLFFTVEGQSFCGLTWSEPGQAYDADGQLYIGGDGPYLAEPAAEVALGYVHVKR